MARDGRPIIVGLGASAGGVEAFHQFFAAVPLQDSLAFIVVLHLAPGRNSMLTEILQNWTKMPVHQAEEGMTPEAGRVYVIPPDTILTLREGRIRLALAAEPRHPSTAINALFASLAADQGENAIGIVLSGTGSDGALGLKAIKECGGVTLAQGSEGNAPQYDGMPAAAIAAGSVDLILPVQDMPARILSIVGERQEARITDADADAEDLQKEVCATLRDLVGHDFSQYKDQTFLRRLQRRMNVVGLSGRPYLDALRADREEAMLLFRDLLIGVTSFFRDAATFKVVEDHVLPRLFAGKTAKDRLRVWVPGCSTGEEAYSLAMMLVEYMDHLSDAPEVQIFATDIDARAIDIARLGRYPHLLLRDVPGDRIARFFTQSDDTDVVSKDVRRYCTFSTHSVIRDPPFSRIDLISCRNLLIYLDVAAQARVIPAFHYALNPEGLLLLGASESVARHTDLFDSLDRRHRIYVKRDVPSPALQFSVFGVDRREAAMRPVQVRENANDRQEALALAHRRIRERFSSAFAVVTAAGEAVYFSPRTGKYLEIAAGLPTANLVAQARAGLRLQLRAALHRAVETGASVERENVVVQFDGGAQAIVLTIEPLPESRGERLYLVVFADGERSQAREDAGEYPPRPLLQDLTIEQLERELRDMREQNQSISEEYETALAELKSANEELHSVNEELQSSNEELETSKEEIQSVNEELQTVNQELTIKLDELDRASSDLRNLFESTRVPTLFLDRKLTIRSFTPAASNLYNLIPADHGRPLTDIVSTLTYDSLAEDVAHVLASLEPIEKRVERRDGQSHYLMHVLPYRSSDNAIEGVLITFTDVTTMVVAEQHDRLLVDELNHRVKNMLTVVLSLATQTRRGALSFSTFWDAFVGRMRALATAYELLTRDQWTDIPLTDVLREELTPYETPGGSNIVMNGPPVFLRPKGALAFGMVVHELATNALKHGALSDASGRIGIVWQIEEAEDSGRDILTWTWRESGGPAVLAPDRHGFGLSLIDRSLRYEMNATVEMDFNAAGLEVRVRLPFDALIAARQTSRLMQV